MTPEGRTGNIVDGFFIGGEGDDLCQPNLTKADLRLTILSEIRAAEIEALEWAAEQALADCHCEPDYTDSHSCVGTRISAHIHAEIERRKTI